MCVEFFGIVAYDNFMYKLLTQSLTILLAIGAVYAIANTPLSDYIGQILGLLILFAVIYIVIKRRRIKDLPAGRQEELFAGSNLEFFAITVGILLTIFLTGGFHSNLFFLVYFLLFGVTFMFHPLTVFVFLAGLLLLFISSALQGDVFANMIRLGSLILLSPIAYFFGREFRRREHLEKEVEKKADQIITDAKEILQSKSSDKKLKKLGDIVEKSDELRREAEKE